MKKLLFISIGLIAFACGGNNTDAEREDNTINEEVEIGAGQEQNPQLEMDSDSAENFEIDTITSATEIDDRKEQ
ncbi:hypothetical protein [Pontibacter roseus]|uniref:hypothetical protein n=1 Tax=Pontibacter roseus TaxID=336989 RepID=UPI0003808824|nr:hypothetical protein [Pontibacter roseus]